MRKQNSLNYEIVRSLFDAEAEGETGGSYFRINGGATPVTMAIPTSIMHRLFCLGQAYGIRQLRYFQSEVKVVIGTVEMPEFVRDLRKLRALLNDEVLHEYIDKLLAELESPPGCASRSISVSTGSYYDKRV